VRALRVAERCHGYDANMSAESDRDLVSKPAADGLGGFAEAGTIEPGAVDAAKPAATSDVPELPEPERHEVAGAAPGSTYETPLTLGPDADHADDPIRDSRPGPDSAAE
jgi:hypothetical protein